jgi:hypothetical protein
MSRLGELFQNYVLRRAGGGQSAAVFWYLPEPPRVHDAASLARYRDDAEPSPLYLMDYRRKLEYTVTDGDGIVALYYGPGTGLQRNPEAASQMALAWHDAWRESGSEPHREQFLRYANVLQHYQDSEGRWAYRFDWGRHVAPWYSSLAQSRGASVMLRAWRVTREERFHAAALRALSRFDRTIEEGGFVTAHPRAGVPYLEEYPAHPTGVLNGFLASLFGLFEVWEWLGDEHAATMFARYRAAADQLLPHYSTSWWTLYDLDPESPFANVHSPRYHRLATDYLRVLATIAPSPTVTAFRDRWEGMAGPVATARAATLKAVKKLLHR